MSADWNWCASSAIMALEITIGSILTFFSDAQSHWVTFHKEWAPYRCSGDVLWTFDGIDHLQRTDSKQTFCGRSMGSNCYEDKLCTDVLRHSVDIQWNWPFIKNRLCMDMLGTFCGHSVMSLTGKGRHLSSLETCRMFIDGNWQHTENLLRCESV